MAWTPKFASVAGGGAHDGTSEANAWTLNEALGNCVANDFVWTKAESGHNLGATGTLTASGSKADNKPIIFKAYRSTYNNTTWVSDMDYGQAYYQGPFDALVNGIDADCTLQMTANNGSFHVLTITNRTAIFFFNFQFLNTASIYKALDIGTGPMAASYNVVFVNCKFSDVYQVYNAQNMFVEFHGCYSHSDIGTTHYLFGQAGGGCCDCVINRGGTTYAGIDLSGDWVNAIGNLIIGGQKSIIASGNHLIYGNTLYDADETCLYINNADAYVRARNNIFVPKTHASDHVVKIGSSGGMYRGDYNCYYAATFGSTAKAGGEVPTPGVNSFNADPDFADAANHDYRPRNPAVLRGGITDMGGNVTQLGAVRQKYQFANRGRMMNPGRLGILR